MKLSKFLKKCLFFLLMIIFSPFIIVLVSLGCLFLILYFPIDLIRYYKKNHSFKKYSPFITLFKRNNSIV